MLTTRFTQSVGCPVPIQQAGMSALANPRLAAAITNAGGVGMVVVYEQTPTEITTTLEQVRTHTDYVYFLTMNDENKVARMVKVWNAPWAMRELGWV